MRYRDIPRLEFTADEASRIEKYLDQIEANIEKEEMTPLERWKITIQRKEPDRVPVNICSMEHNAHVGGYKIIEVLKEPKKAVIAALAMLSKYGCDTVTPWAEPHIIGMELLGTKVEYPEDRTAMLKEFPVKSVEDLDKIKIPDPYKDGHLPMILQILEFVSDKVGGKVPILQNTNGPWGYAGDIRGYDKLLRDVRKDPDFVHALLEITTEVAITINKAVQEAGRNIYPHTWDAMAEPNLIGVKGYEEFVWPYEKKLFEHLTPPGAVLGVSGKTTNILEKEVETGAIAMFVGFGGAEPAGVERERQLFRKAKELVGGRITLIYNCAYAAELLSGTPEENKNLAKETIKIGAPGGGFILLCGVVPVDAPARNCLAIMEAARTYGKYPIKI